MPRKTNIKKSKAIKAKNGKKIIKSSKSNNNTCPVGLLCINTSYLLTGIIIILLLLFGYLIIFNNNKNNSNDILNNFDDYDSSNNSTNKNNSTNNSMNSNNSTNNSTNNSMNSNNSTNNSKNNKRVIKVNDIPIEETPQTNIIINYEPKTSPHTHIVNKDYERIVNPLSPPERRNFHLDVNPLQGVPINIPTRGEKVGYMQVGVLHKEEIDDDNKEIGKNSEPVILPLFGCPTYQGSNKWSYYTATDKYNQVKLPITNNSRVCNSEYGCDELYDGDNVSLPAYNGNFKVSKYEFDKPRYIPHL